MTAPDDTWNELLRNLSPPQQASLHSLPDRLGIAAHGARWEFARLPPVVATPRFFGSVTASLRAHHRACFWGLTADRLADGEVEGVEPWELELLHHAWRDALSVELGAPRAEAIAARGLQLQHEGFALERALLRSGTVSFERYAACLALRTAWFHASTLAPLSVAVRALAERGLQQLMLGLQLLDDAVDETHDLATRGASWPRLLGCSPDAMISASVAHTLAAGDTFLAGGWNVLGGWCSARAAEVRRRFGGSADQPLAPVTFSGFWSAA